MSTSCRGCRTRCPDERAAEFQLAGTVPDNATLLPGCGKPPLTRVLYSDVIGRPLSPVRAPGAGPPGAACAPTPGGYFLTSAGPTKKEAPEPGGARGAEVSTTIYCIHIPRAMKRGGHSAGPALLPESKSHCRVAPNKSCSRACRKKEPRVRVLHLGLSRCLMLRLTGWAAGCRGTRTAAQTA